MRRGLYLVFVSYPSEREAAAAAKKMVLERLAACVSIYPAKSIYSWEGKLVAEREWEAVFKVAGKDYEKLEKRLAATHPYKVPQVIAVKAERVLSKYLDWAWLR